MKQWSTGCRTGASPMVRFARSTCCSRLLSSFENGSKARAMTSVDALGRRAARSYMASPLSSLQCRHFGGMPSDRAGVLETGHPTDGTALRKQELAGEVTSPAPSGFDWAFCRLIGSKVACPAGWHFSESDANGPTSEALAYFVTKEKLSGERSEFRTGLTLRLYRNIRQSLGHSPGEFVRECLQLVDLSHRRSVVARWDQSEGKDSEGTTQPHVQDVAVEDEALFDSRGVEYKEVSFDPSDPQPIRVRLMFFINKRTQALFEVIFESPEEEWEEAWRKYGAMMMTHLYINPQV